LILWVGSVRARVMFRVGVRVRVRHTKPRKSHHNTTQHLSRHSSTTQNLTLKQTVVLPRRVLLSCLVFLFVCAGLGFGLCSSLGPGLP
jgi:hypothetical protein